MQVSQTERYTIIFGPNWGYPQDDSEKMEISIFCRVVRAIANTNTVHKLGPLTFIVTPGRAVYSVEHGCPITGEPIYILQGERNPSLCDKTEDYRTAWILLARGLQGVYQYTTVRLIEESVILRYFSSKLER
jgi:hypothetical protein